MGVRSLFFLLAGIVDKLRYSKVGLAIVLVFVGAKMALVDLAARGPPGQPRSPWHLCAVNVGAQHPNETWPPVVDAFTAGPRHCLTVVLDNN